MTATLNSIAEARAHNAHGVELQNAGDSAGALRRFDAALEIDPAHAPAYINRGAIHFANGELELAASDFTTAIGLDPCSIAAYHNRGAVRLAQRDYRGAQADFDAEIALAPAACRGHLSRAHARYHLRDPDAEEDYRRAFRLDPAYAARRVIQLLARSIRPTASVALADCEAHLRENPDDFHSFSRRGLIRLLLRDEESARPDFERYRALNPEGAFKLDLLIAEARRGLIK